MSVVATGVHQAGSLRAVSHLFPILDPERVHIRPDRYGLALRRQRTAGDDPSALEQDFGGQPRRAKLIAQVSGRLELFSARLRMSVKVTADSQQAPCDRVDVVVDSLSPVDHPDQDSPRSPCSQPVILIPS